MSSVHFEVPSRLLLGSDDRSNNKQTLSEQVKEGDSESRRHI